MILGMKATTFYKKQANGHDDKTSETEAFESIRCCLLYFLNLIMYTYLCGGAIRRRKMQDSEFRRDRSSIMLVILLQKK